MSESAANRRFPTTQWSIVLGLHSGDAEVARRAVETIFQQYRYPLYGYLRMSGLAHEDAEDVLQSFFEKLLRNDALADANSSKGRLRTFLLTSLRRFRINWQRGEANRRRKVRPASDLSTLDLERFQLEVSSEEQSPENFFDRHWAREMVSIAMRQLRALFRRRGKETLFELLEPKMTDQGKTSEETLAQAAALGLSPEGVRVALHRLRREFRQVLLREVGKTLGEGEDPNDELQYLLSVFGANSKNTSNES